MAPLKLLTVVSSSLFFLAKANGEPAAQKTTYTVDLGSEGKCLAEVNSARVAAGFSELAQAAKPTSRLPKGAGAAASGDADGAGQSNEKKASALICMTAPDVLADGANAPFTDEQWKQIVTALEGSASAVAPGVVGFALAIVGLSML
ncbi:SAG family member [Eimeria mitis]|uniref:SAG family member n=1 Tax=Eimeria mitis TaxID=44415 RepID=U6JP88_9EIME|nr:SAG family member [Eimeria mitis]CDJ27294.1 SAG family member [Eimeria mitis]